LHHGAGGTWALSGALFLLLSLVKALAYKRNLLVNSAHLVNNLLAILSRVDVCSVVLWLETNLAQASTRASDEGAISTHTLASCGSTIGVGGGTALLATTLAGQVVVPVDLALKTFLEVLGALVSGISTHWAWEFFV
jgi:hypothetical protein